MKRRQCSRNFRSAIFLETVWVYKFMGEFPWKVSPISVWIRENTDQKSSEYRHFSRSELYENNFSSVLLKQVPASYKDQPPMSATLWSFENKLTLWTLIRGNIFSLEKAICKINKVLISLILKVSVIS